MAQSDAAIFLENLRMWDRPRYRAGAEGPAVLKLEDNVDRIVDEMFERFCELELSRPRSFIGNC